MINTFLGLLTIGTFISAIFTITSINPINSVVGLIAVYVHIALYLIGLTLNFIGLSYLIIYVGAIAILFLFVVMMMNIKYIELSEVNQEYTKILPLGGIIGILFILELLSSSLVPLDIVIGEENFLWLNEDTQILKNNILINKTIINFLNKSSNLTVLVSYSSNVLWDSIFNSFNHIENLGHALYSYGLLWFMLSSFILLLAMISPIVLCFN